MLHLFMWLDITLCKGVPHLFMLHLFHDVRVCYDCLGCICLIMKICAFVSPCLPNKDLNGRRMLGRRNEQVGLAGRENK